MRCPLVVFVAALLGGVGLPAPGQAQSTRATVRKVATEVLSARYPGSADHLDVRVRRVRGDLDTTRALRLRFSDSEGTPTGLAQVDLRTRGADGAWKEAGWALLRVARLDSVVTVQSQVAEGETIPRSELETAWIETSNLSGEPLRASKLWGRADRESLVAARYLRAGRVLRKQDVRRPYTTEIGSLIRMRFRQGRLVFRLSCTAREPGFVDEVIRVHCPELETMYRARITGEDTAQWVETL
ncbi:MAG: flagella basal body P-ring formation protein FlgA [Salinibacter sp.]